MTRGNIFLATLLWSVIAFLVVYPLSILVLESFKIAETGTWGISNYLGFFQDTYYLKIFGNTLLLSMLVLLTTTLVGLPLAYILARYRQRGKTVFTALILLPIVLPDYAGIFAFIIFLGKYGTVDLLLMKTGWIKTPINFIYGLHGLVFIQSLHMLPFIVLGLSAGFTTIDPSFEEAAEVQGASGFWRFLTVTLPLCTAMPIQTSVGSISVSFSVGVAAFGSNDSEILPLLEKIDHALYRAKVDGRDQVRMAAHTHVPWNSSLLRQALADNRVRLATQVIVDLQNGQVIADEALARVETVSGEMVEAKDFVDMAEGLGLMAEIDRQIVRNVMQSCVTRLSQDGLPGFSHFVNVSPQLSGTARSGRGNAHQCHGILPGLRRGDGAGQAHRAGTHRASAHRESGQAAGGFAALYRLWLPVGAG